MANLAGLTPEVWAGQILRRLNDAIVFRQICNTDYEGDIANFGDTVKINEIGPVTVNTYSSTSTAALTVQSLSDAQKLLQINQAKSFSFWIDDVVQKQIKPKVMSEAMTNASFALAKNVEQYIAALHSEAGITVGGTSSTGADISSTNILKYFSIAQWKLDEANVPVNGRWAVVPPWMAQKLALAKVAMDTANTGTLMSGRIAQGLYGFNVYMSNNVVNGTPAGDSARVLFGYTGSITLATQILTVETVRPSLIGFKTLVKGLMVYGAKVTRPNTLGVLHADYTAEAT